MSSNVTLLGVQTMPMTAQIALPTSMSQPTSSPVLGSMPSIGNASDDVASCKGPADRSEDGTSLAMLLTAPGYGPCHGPGYETNPVGATVDEPQAASRRAAVHMDHRYRRCIRTPSMF